MKAPLISKYAKFTNIGQLAIYGDLDLIEWVGEPNDPGTTRCGCFLSDLTGLASGLSASSPGGYMASLINTCKRNCTR